MITPSFRSHQSQRGFDFLEISFSSASPPSKPSIKVTGLPLRPFFQTYTQGHLFVQTFLQAFRNPAPHVQEKIF
jgi:hypothetical protein